MFACFVAVFGDSGGLNCARFGLVLLLTCWCLFCALLFGLLLLFCVDLSMLVWFDMSCLLLRLILVRVGFVL